MNLLREWTKEIPCPTNLDKTLKTAEEFKIQQFKAGSCHHKNKIKSYAHLG